VARLSFLGATGTVTGSRFLLEAAGLKLLVDCGLFQGSKENRLRNWDPFPVPVGEIDAVLVTHAHTDHTAWLPRLHKEGYRGPIYCTHSTHELARILLPDSGYLQEEDAYWANKRGYSKHEKALPLFTVADAEAVLELFRPVHYGQDLWLADELRVKFKDAGHILGSAYVDIRTGNGSGARKILLSGDIGRPRHPILRDPSQVFDVDYLVMESTYGDRLHEASIPMADLARVVNESVERGGVLVIPAFAVGRTQTLLLCIRELEERGEIPVLPVYIDSPMGIDATAVFNERMTDQNLLMRLQVLQGKSLFKPRRLHVCRTRDESKAVNAVKSRAIIISSSGMVTGGRILHHLFQRLPQERNSVLFTGFQAEGTRGRKILEGAETVKIHGQPVPVAAHVESLDGFSGHADYQELLAWCLGFNRPPERTFLVHGEAEASAALKERIGEELRWEVEIPTFRQEFELDL
jgi:metallo-beta-lactamase family protein